MIGGGMLLCAVGAMILIALWSITRDDAPDSKPRGGLLAFQVFDKPPRKRGEQRRQRRAVKQDEPEMVASRSPTAQRPRALRFDPDEMAEIAEEAEANLPRFVRDSREEY